MKKILSLLLVSALTLSVLPAGNLVFAEEEIIEEKIIEDVVTSEWVDEESQDPIIMQQLKENDGLLVHNNGDPIETDIVSDGGEEFNLFAIHKTEVNGSNYETYYFENREESDLSQLKEEAQKEQVEIEINELGYTEEEPKEDELFSFANIFSSISSIFVAPTAQAAIASQPKGGHYKTYNWTFYSTLGGVKSKLGTFSSVNHLTRKSSDTSINGKKGSVWDVKTENTWNATGAPARLEKQTTRLAVPYSAQKLLSYGPKTKSNGSATVTLEQILTPMQWSFKLSNFSLKDSSSISNKYGRWIYTRNLGYPDPFVTKPGIRASNTSGNFALQVSHTLNIDYKDHNTGVMTISVPDR